MDVEPPEHGRNTWAELLTVQVHQALVEWSNGLVLWLLNASNFGTVYIISGSKFDAFSRYGKDILGTGKTDYPNVNTYCWLCLKMGHTPYIRSFVGDNDDEPLI